MNAPEIPSYLLVPSTLHRILRGGPRHVLSLRQAPDHTLTFEEYSNALSQQKQHHDDDENHPTIDINMLVKSAYRDGLVDSIQRTNDIGQIHSLILELHEELKQLIPNRTDLHGLLQSEQVVDNAADVIRMLIAAAQALIQLESEVRAETTASWIEMANAAPVDNNISWIVTSVMYLLFKAELCKADKHDFYLVHFWGARILREGPMYERNAFEERFGKLEEASTAPATREWLKAAIEKTSQARPDLLNSLEERHKFIRRAWVDDILFRSQSDDSLPLPEIFVYDSDALESIRNVTRLAAAGSTLALHACNMAGQSAEILSATELESNVELCRAALVEAMGSMHKPPQAYKRDIEDATVALAKQWKPSLDSTLVQSLRNRVDAVISGQDPVIRLLLERMKECFNAIVVQRDDALVPSRLASGRGQVSHQNTEAEVINDVQVFQSRGLAFYASDLALSALSATSVIDLAWRLYGANLLTRIVQELCRCIE